MKAYQATGDRSPRSELKGFSLAQVGLPSAGNWLGVALVEVASQRAAGQGSIVVGDRHQGTFRPVAGCRQRQGPDQDLHAGAGVSHACHLAGQGAVERQSTVLSFATPLLCASRMCGPVVDEQLQAFQVMGDQANFIHVEIYPGRKTDQPAPCTAHGAQE